MKNNEKGITLVALVITIIVLLILAGVTIAALSGDNGILTNASKAQEETAIGNAKDLVSMAINEATNGYYDAMYINPDAENGKVIKNDQAKTAVNYIRAVTAEDAEITIWQSGAAGSETYTVQIKTDAKTPKYAVAVITTNGGIKPWNENPEDSAIPEKDTTSTYTKITNDFTNPEEP